MKKGVLWLRYLFLFLAFASASVVYAQEITVTGKVTDAADGSSIPGVTIAVKNTTIGTVTDIDGKYSIKVQTGAVLVYSFVGYISQEVTITSQTAVDIVLSASVTSLGEVVVIGYGQVKKGDATGAVATVGREDFNQGMISSPQQLVIGKIPGVTVTTINGAPGGDAVIRIRGGSSINASNDPLVVIDGVPISNTATSGARGTLAMVNPDDIESYVILKDASATAIYGSRASNGVIIITTKKGKPGTKKLGLEYSGNVSMSAFPKTYKVLNGDEFTNLLHQRYPNRPDIDSLLGTTNANTDWQKEIYQTAIGTDHNLGLTGAVSTMPYRVSIGYMYQNGTLNTDNMQRTTIGANLNPTFFKNYLKLSVNAKFMNITNRFADNGAIGNALAFDPTKPVMSGDTAYGGYWTWLQADGTPVNQATRNPVALLNQKVDNSYVVRFLGNVQADYKLHFFPDLRAVLNLGIDYSNSNGEVKVPIDAAWTWLSYGTDNSYTQTKNDKVLDFYLNYTKDVKSIKSKFDVMAGYSWQHFYFDAANYNRNVYHTIGDTAITKKEYYLVSFYGRFNYSLMDKYLLTFTLRDDGSSKFSESTRWGLFPSVALAWKINEESFLKDSKSVSQLKLRFGWGKTGQQDIGDSWYPYIPIYTGSNPFATYQFGNLFYVTLRPDGYDQNIKWEETTTTNIGLDFGFLKDRITGSLEYYIRYSKDLLNFIPVPAGTNLSNYIWTNMGDMENKGIEGAIDAKAISTKDWLWSIGVNASYNKNKITKLTMTDDPNYAGFPTGLISGGVGNTVQIQSVGFPVYSFYVYQQVYDANGKPIEGLYVDRNGDGVINDKDKYHYKSANPISTIGLYSTLSYKKWSLGFAGHAAIGNYVYNNVSANRGVYSNLYRPEGPYISNVTTDVYDVNFVNNQYLSDYYVQDGSYFKLDYLTLGYDFGNLAKNTAHLRASITLNNVFTITRYKGIDPELISTTTVGLDNNVYPRSRVFVLGVNLSF